MKTGAAILILSCFVIFLPKKDFAQQPDSVNAFQFSTSRTSVENLSISFASSKKYLSLRSAIVPSAFIAYGLSSLRAHSTTSLNQSISHEVTEDMPGFKTRVDDYLKYAPAVSTYALSFAGVRAKDKLLDRTIVFAVSSTLTNQIVTTLKHATHQLRPDGSTYNSFPSGHTATAFVGAEFMNQELGWHSRWYSVAGYSLAATTGALRIANNRHWLSDVIAGAGIGILTTKFTYWVYSKVEKKIHKKQAALF